MSENFKKFLELISSNKELETKALACNDLEEEKGKLALIELAKENGIELTDADFEKKAAPASGELSDDELDAVAGGANGENGGCVCVVIGAGGGVDDFNGKIFGCYCGAYGQGGDGNLKDANCRCVFGGGGADNGQN